MDKDHEHNAAANQARRDNPTLNQSGDARDPSSVPVRAERAAGEPNAGNADYERGRADALNERVSQTDVEGTARPGELNGLGYNGEFRIGQITLAVSGSGVRLRHSNDGTETEVAEPVIEGVLEEAFFTRKIDADGNDRKGSATKP